MVQAQGRLKGIPVANVQRTHPCILTGCPLKLSQKVPQDFRQVTQLPFFFLSFSETPSSDTTVLTSFSCIRKYPISQAHLALVIQFIGETISSWVILGFLPVSHGCHECCPYRCYLAYLRRHLWINQEKFRQLKSERKI